MDKQGRSVACILRSLSENPTPESARLADMSTWRSIQPFGPVESSFDIADLTRSVLLLFHGRITLLGVHVEAELPAGVLVSASQNELRQVLVNMIGNALDAMPKGGRLILRLREFVDHHANRLCVRLTLADTGQGMAREVLQRITWPRGRSLRMSRQFEGPVKSGFHQLPLNRHTGMIRRLIFSWEIL